VDRIPGEGTTFSGRAPGAIAPQSCLGGGVASSSAAAVLQASFTGFEGFPASPAFRRKRRESRHGKGSGGSTSVMVRAAGICLVVLAFGSCRSPDVRPSAPEMPEAAPPAPTTSPPLLPNGPDSPPEPVPAALQQPFEEGGVSLYEFSIADGDWKELIQLPKFGRWYRCSLSWCGERYDDVGIRASGQITRMPGNPKPSLRVSFSKFGQARRFHGLSGFKLDNLGADPSMMRERLAYGCYRAAGLPAPREVHARVKMNGRELGLYAVEERIGSRYVKDHVPGPKSQLYYWTGDEDDFTWKGSFALDYVPNPLRPRFRTLPFGGPDMAALADTIMNKSYQEAARVFDVEVLLRQLAVEILTGETDGLVGVPMPGETRTRWMSNFFLYRDSRSGKYRLLVWDRDQSFWRPVGTPITQGMAAHELTRKLVLDPPGNLERLREILRELLDGPLAPEHLESRLDDLRREIRPSAYRDERKKAGSNARFEEEVDRVRTYIRANAESLRRQLAQPAR
jgi:CotH kinase protein